MECPIGLESIPTYQLEVTGVLNTNLLQVKDSSSNNSLTLTQTAGAATALTLGYSSITNTLTLNSINTTSGIEKISFQGADLEKGYISYTNNAPSASGVMTLGSTGYCRLATTKGFTLDNKITSDITAIQSPDRGALVYDSLTMRQILQQAGFTWRIKVSRV